MVNAELSAKFALNRFSLEYNDPALEAEYRIYQSPLLARALRPLLIALLPMVALAGLSDLTSLVPVSLLPWQACAVLLALLSGLLVLMARQRSRRFLQPALLITFVLFGISLLTRMGNSDALLRYFPAYFILIMVSHFIGLRFTYGVAAALILLAGLATVIIWNQIGVRPLLATGSFVVPGYFIASTAGYTMERQRRRLFAQLKMLEKERSAHELMAMHDPLTALPNRYLLRERMTQSLARSKRQHGQFAVLFVDLDDFKDVNDNFGHAIGDLVLKQIADNLQHQVRGEDTVARLGGDEFVILSEHIEDVRGARTAADRIHAAVSRPIPVRRKPGADIEEVKVTCSIGISLCPRDGDNLDQLIDRADIAMYSAKRFGKGGARFFSQEDQQSPDAERSTL